MARRKSRSAQRRALTVHLGLRPGSAGPAQRELLGGLLVSAGVLTVLAFVSGDGSVSERWLGFLRWSFGWMAAATPILLGGLGAWLILDAMDGRADVKWERPAAAAGLFAACASLLHLLADAFDPAATLESLAEAGVGGGHLGYAVGASLGIVFGRVPSGALLIAAIAACATVAAGHTLRDGARQLWLGTLGLVEDARRLLRGLTARRSAGHPPASTRHPASSPTRRIEAPQTASPAAAVGPEPTIQVARAEAPPGSGGPVRQVSHPWRLPSIDEILEPAEVHEARGDDADVTGRSIEQVLGEFGVPARVVKIDRGPTVTLFGLEPGYVERAGTRSRVKVNTIVRLRSDLELALSASPIRILAPVPGRPYVGVEVPNPRKSMVFLRDVLESDEFRQTAARAVLPVALGRDTSGKPVAADLGAMPHLLVAGTTGAGKSVAMNALICTLLMTHTPETLRLLLVDPKRVELVQYAGLPHLAAPVVVDLDHIVGLLQWTVREMDRRYREFAAARVRNLDAYNLVQRKRGEPVLPYLVLLVDELADLMMIAPEETERLITRLAQLARATGIHLVLATQRPSVDVVTGLIKANISSRIAFAVSSGVDSRVILDTVGAEKLLGRGDMLYQAGDSSRLLRLQGCFTRDVEIERLCRYWRWAAPAVAPSGAEGGAALTIGLPEPLVQPDVFESAAGAAGAPSRQRDELWAEAVALLEHHRTASTSFLQRRLRIGYSRAARLLDELEEAGIVGPARGSYPREVLVPPPDSAEAPDIDGPGRRSASTPPDGPWIDA